MDKPPKKLSPEVLAKLKAEKAKRDAKKAAEEIFVPAAPTEPMQEVVPEPIPEPIPETINQVEDAEEEMSQEEFDYLYLQALKELRISEFLNPSILMRRFNIGFKTAIGIIIKLEFEKFTDNGYRIPGKIEEIEAEITRLEDKYAEENSTEFEEEDLEQPSAPEASTTGSNEEKLAALNQTIKNAKEKIRALNLELAEAMRAEKSGTEESLEKDLKNLKGELDEYRTKLADAYSSWRRKIIFVLFSKKDKEYKQKIKALGEEIKEKERLLGLEKYKRENPFKYSLVEKMAEKNRKIIFGEKLTLKEINRQLKTDGEEISRGWYFDQISVHKDYVVDFSPTGFYVKVSNPDKITDPRGATYNVVTQNKEITYDLVKPDGELFSTNLSHLGAKRALATEATFYLERQQAVFEDEKEIKELESITGREAKKEFLERKRMERIRNIKDVKSWINYHEPLLRSEDSWHKESAQAYIGAAYDGPYTLLEYLKEKNQSEYVLPQHKDSNEKTIQQIEDINKKYDNLIAKL